MSDRQFPTPSEQSVQNAVELTPERIDAMWKLAMKYVANTFFEYSFVPGSPRPTLPMVFADLILQAASSVRPNSEAQETSEERRLRHRLEKIDAALDDLGAPKTEVVDGLTMELSRVGRIKRLAASAPSAIESMEI